MKKALALIILSGLFFAKSALAVCPVCAVAVAAGIGFSRWLGVDDMITGLWVGGLIVALIAWTEGWLDKKNYLKFKGRIFVDILFYYALVVVPLIFIGLIKSAGDKLVLGIIAGSIAFWFGMSWYPYLKERNGGKPYFPFQKVVMPILPILILSILFYYLTK